MGALQIYIDDDDDDDDDKPRLKSAVTPYSRTYLFNMNVVHKYIKWRKIKYMHYCKH